MQLMPSTAANVAGAPVDEASLTMPAHNIDLGARYLRTLIDRYDGRVIPAIAAYNAGPDAVSRWQARAGERPGDEFVELISFRETRQYVKTVLRNYRAYRMLSGATGAPAPDLY
jgi:soluble lytic murein transglycosylase